MLNSFTEANLENPHTKNLLRNNRGGSWRVNTNCIQSNTHRDTIMLHSAVSGAYEAFPCCWLLTAKRAHSILHVRSAGN
jgi:hypothetical protein